MKIVDVILTKSYTGFYFDDQKAITQGAGHDGFMYVGEPVTEGFQSIRQAGEAISIQLVLEDGTVGYGDCAAVQYSGAGGRDPLFLASDFIPFIEKEIVPQLIGEDVSLFRPLAEKYDRMEINGKSYRNGKFLLEPFLLDWYREEGGEYLSYGSDSHRTEQLLRSYNEAKAYALAHDMNYFVYFEKRRPHPYRIG